MTSRVTRSAGETEDVAAALAGGFAGGEVVLLSGELGAGKTVFVQGMARGLGFDGSVSSKSFVLLGEYPGRLTLYHADLYRLEDPQQVQDLALDEISSGGVLVVEWPERAGGAVLPDEHLHVEFAVISENVRELRADPTGDRAKQIIAALSD